MKQPVAATTEPQTMLDWALLYSQQYGWPVFPCHSPRFDNTGAVSCSCADPDCTGNNLGKHPRTTNGLKDATTNEKQIRVWWTRWPDANIAMPTGTASGILAIDEDGEKGAASLAEKPTLPPTFTVATGRGFHYYLRYPQLETGQRIITKPGVLAGVDSKGDLNGYVILPPSLHRSGRHYSIADNAPLADAPPWWIELVVRSEAEATRISTPPPPIHLNGHGRDVEHYVRCAIEDEANQLAAQGAGGRNDRLNAAAWNLANFVSGGQTTEDVIREALHQACLSNGMIEDDGAASFEKTFRSGFAAGLSKKPPRTVPEREQKRVILRGVQARAHIQGKPVEHAEAVDSDTAATGPPDPEDETEENESGIKAPKKSHYGIRFGRTLHTIETTNAKTGTSTTTDARVWDGAAHIVQEMTDEEGRSIYGIEGRTRLGRHFAVEIPAAKMTDAKTVAAVMKNSAGAGCVFYAGMEKHIAPAIDSFTDWRVVQALRRFNRVGWTADGKEFIVPGMEPPNTTIALERKLPYEVRTADALAALPVFDALINAQRPEMTTVCLAMFLQAPLAMPAGWRDERYALFIAGRSGSFKSSWAQMAMCLYGPEFQNEDRLIKFGQGATNNAVMDFFARACDVPILVDNYKPSTGDGEKGLRNLIHAALEGGEKDRLNRNSEQRGSRAVHTWPVFTGEDVPGNDAASMARVLVVPFAWNPDWENADLTEAQSKAHLLCNIGGSWIRWLMSEEGKMAADYARAHFTERRTHWASVLRGHRRDMVNLFRVATNLATNDLAFGVACNHPIIGPKLTEFKAAHARGLLEIAAGMAQHTAQSFEATRYLEALRALVASGRCVLLPTGDIPEMDRIKMLERAKLLGWRDAAGVYLLPEIAFSEACALLRDSGGLGMVTKNTLHKQLAQIDAISKSGKDDHVTIVKRIGSETRRVLHIKPEKFDAGEPDAEDGEDANV